MLSDEEKKAIEYLKIEYEKLMKEDNILFPLYKSDAKRLIDIIEKQSKEIEELKTINQMQKYRIEVIDERELISKDKIKEILGIEEDINNEKLLSLLQTIVDENARLEDIEDRKVQIEYNNVFNKGVKSVEDKIKAKIEEYDDKEMTVNLANRSAGKTFQQAVRNEVRKVLQSLLEKE